jgi:hypothetical protein
MSYENGVRRMGKVPLLLFPNTRLLCFAEGRCLTLGNSISKKKVKRKSSKMNAIYFMSHQLWFPLPMSAAGSARGSRSDKEFA